MRPVHETPQIVPLVLPAHVDAIAETNRHAFREIEIVGDQQCCAVTDVDDEPLVTSVVGVVTQKAADEARDFDPPPVIAFAEADTSSP